LKVDFSKRIREVKWTTEHSLTAEGRQAIIMQKVDRARQELEARNKVDSKLRT
jgi:hypothetical protein|tara:strand:+ start:113 stop:271 length:159 start_codon:yes stop_codon:yes gene_type:complete